MDISTLIDYDASPDTDYGTIPSGYYTAIIVASDRKQTKSGNGSYIELEHQICEGEYQGKTLWARLNLDNPNPIAVKIANQHMAQIRHATGKLKVKDSSELHDIPMLIRVELEMAGAKRERDGNEIKEWKALEGGSAAPTSAPAAAQAPTTPGASSSQSAPAAHPGPYPSRS